ncbi:MAG: hypothetical protein D6744_18555 [Planctomycetota bacterium]|nr:MAG: hypothetical protein D6744_18555 [Planctomycetota bacterium]
MLAGYALYASPAPIGTFAMNPTRDTSSVRVACDAMCGGLARRLRILGVDASFTPGIADDELLRHAEAESRVVISSDGPLFRRRPIAGGRVRALRLPVGLPLDRQLELAIRELRLRAEFPRCARCNGELAVVPRTAVADCVPARTLIWRREFFRCVECGHVYWQGSHWRRIGDWRCAHSAGGADDI